MFAPGTTHAPFSGNRCVLTALGNVLGMLAIALAGAPADAVYRERLLVAVSNLFSVFTSALWRVSSAAPMAVFCKSP
ncbi:hypothetical protein DWU98_05615 [Dyella monticola]|uniref:Uncharacterized protein n=1 Tax=Dyella monticola TaxID=1927958 RepID=A0A370X631_9GAMM|nr:hypothetical protein DWU98_05615 [Dyella monticola]